MGYGYALLPVAANSVSNMTFRLTPSEKTERDEWIIGALDHGLEISKIAYEVGLSEQRVKQIIKTKKNLSPQRTGKKKFKTPREAAIHVLETEEMHPACFKANHKFDGGICNDCWGKMSILESEYDENGWPYSWAMLGQERYIEMAGRRLSDVK